MARRTPLSGSGFFPDRAAGRGYTSPTRAYTPAEARLIAIRRLTGRTAKKAGLTAQSIKHFPRY